ncbi:MAG: DMT family transporter [Flavobacteriales bacterium]|nr:DMT family transporter [Flavobacteriales bacterium]MCX7768197.1 DMT family transporter [Flavobacteriales bacterium]MDW8409148.1 DMT family transporter [Flavobacteriales bacterium]
MGKYIRRLGATPKGALVLLHTAVFLWGFTAILGRLITLKALPLVWHRLWLTCTVLIFFSGCRRGLKSLKRPDYLRFGFIGLIVATHWLCFYEAIKVANISVALVALATGPLFAAIMEPFLTQTRVRWQRLVTGFVGLAGLIVIFLETSGLGKGFVLGVAAAALAALFSSLNKKYLSDHAASAVTFVELFSGFVCLTPLVLLSPPRTWTPVPSDWLWLLLLSAGCTALPFILSLLALRHVSAFASNLAVNLEPVYGMILAAIIFHEHETLSVKFYAGSALVLLAVVLNTWLERKS